MLEYKYCNRSLLQYCSTTYQGLQVLVPQGSGAIVPKFQCQISLVFDGKSAKYDWDNDMAHDVRPVVQMCRYMCVAFSILCFIVFSVIHVLYELVLWWLYTVQ